MSKYCIEDMNDDEKREFLERCTKRAYEFTMDELENDIETGYDSRQDYYWDENYKMFRHCNVVLGVLEAIYKERTEVTRRKNKIDKILSEEEDDDEWWVI